MDLSVFLIYAGAVIVLAAALATFNRFMYFLDREDPEVYDALLNNEELEKHAVEIARNHITDKKIRRYYSLESRMNKNFKYIMNVYKNLNEHVKDMKQVTPASEWLLDNFYIIEEQVKEIRQNLSKAYYFQLPRLKSGSLKGYPRVYAIALELVSHTDGRFDDRALVNFITAYQTQALLSSGELWAIPLMVRMALIEHIRYICGKIIESQDNWYKAEKLADVLLQQQDKSPEELLALAKEQMKHIERITPSFAEHLLNRLKKHGIEIALFMHYIDEKLIEQHTTGESITQLEHNEQASRQVSMGNSITSLRFISTLDWTEIFEMLSQVEQILRTDPASIYPQMDFSSRDYYRHEVEKLSKKIKISEIQVARKAIECADEENKHVGYYLFGEEKTVLREKLGYTKSKSFTNTFIYLSSILVLTAILSLLLIYYGYRSNTAPWALVISAVAILLLSSDIAVTLVNWMVTHTVEPDFLPKLELREGIPENAKTIVVIPTLLPNEKRAVKLVEQLEEYYLANRESNLFFALVGDFKDSPEEAAPSDNEIINSAVKGIGRLNDKYAKGSDIFFYFHRKRVLCPSQNKWMGWERKRGALMEFNELIRGSKNTGYTTVTGDTSVLADVRYVITIDADTRLPIDAAKKLIGTILHPLNMAVVDENRGKVVRGYGLLQPRINLDIVSANASKFTRIFAGQGGIDIYTNAISDVYQDLFKEGIFTGKGIYEIDVFRTLLKDAIPENTLLSHDLIEGCYVRTGLVTDIELIDGYPARYNAFSMRLHRWVRGDWQIIGWLSGKVRNREGKRVKNPISAISRWKIIDNLRRSLLPPAAMLMFLMLFTALEGNVTFWLFFTVLTVVFPIVVSLFDILVSKFSSSFREKSCCPVAGRLKLLVCQLFLIFAFIPYQAYLMANAIAKTLVRVLVTKKNMLEWVTAADMEVALKNDLPSFYRRMWLGSLQGLVLIVLAVFFRYDAIEEAVVLAVIWLAAPYLAYHISVVEVKKAYALGKDDTLELRSAARKTWSFFEDFVTALDNYLPPDNYQESPPNGIAHRTSPTNIGLLLVTFLGARDFGYVTTSEMLDKLNKTITTIEKLKKWKGHLYNWYDTVTLDILRPRYISTVDSGNLIGYLMTLREGLLEYKNNPVIDKNNLLGLGDTIRLVNEENKQPLIEPAKVENALARKACDIWEFHDILNSIAESNIQRKPHWGVKLHRMLICNMKELNVFFPWVEYLKNMPAEYKEELDGLAISELFKKETINNARLSELSYQYKDLAAELEGLSENAGDQGISKWIKGLGDRLKGASESIEGNLRLFDQLLDRIDGIINEMRFKPLYDAKKKLFSIGFNEEEEQLTRSYYDLLASEARQASLIAIARGEVKKEHWFTLDRTLTTVDGYKGLVSWTGTMFEYLMPMLIMRNYENTLLDETYKFVLRCQMEYGKKRKVPWGVSESGYYSFDFRLNYQYKAFGIPALGLKRGLINDTVIAPYATVLGLLVQPREAMKNLLQLKQEQVDTNYGYYEAIDYTPERMKRGKKSSIVKSFMAHHQGMSFVALANILYDNVMQNRFHNDPSIKAVELLLQEKIPSKVIFAKDYKEKIEPFKEAEKEELEYTASFGLNKNSLPEVYILSNGSYSMMVTDSGAGYSKYNDIMLSRWREDALESNYGTFFYVKDIGSNKVWSAGVNPCGGTPDKYRVVFSQDKAAFMRTDDTVDTQMEIVVSPEDDIEVRRISITNHAEEPKDLEVSSYMETVLTAQSADIAHPAFSNLFIKTEFLHKYNALLSVRKPREESKAPLWAVHKLTVNEDIIGGVQYETDRSKFIGRNHNLKNPIAIEENYPLSNSSGAVIDPIMSLRARIRVQPGQTIKLHYITGTAKTREAALLLAEKYHDHVSIERAFELSWTRSQVELRYLNLRKDEIELFRHMMSHILYNSPVRRQYEDSIKKNTKGQPELWSFGISGDLPIVLISVSRHEEAELVREVLKAHEYWRIKGLNVDLVIINEDEGSYTQPLFNYLQDIVSISHVRDIREKSGGVFIKQGSILREEDKHLLVSAARIVLSGKNGPLAVQLKGRHSIYTPEYKSWDKKPHKYEELDIPPMELTNFNGYGGFANDGKEYVLRLGTGLSTPLPWINVVSNGRFGFHMTEAGACYTWSQNSRENKLTPWSNDPVIDPSGEIFYIRDEETGEFWSVTPQPVREKGEYVVRYGFGYVSFMHNSHGVEQELTEFVPLDADLKLAVIKLGNRTRKKKKLSVTFYIRPVLGVNDQLTYPHVITELAENGMLAIRNNYNSDFSGRIAFINSSEKIRAYTGDRREFIGAKGCLSNPEGLKKEALSCTIGAGLDPCACIQVQLELKPNEQKEILFQLGQGKDLAEAVSLSEKFRRIESARTALSQVTAYWDGLLSAIRVRTPDQTMDLMLNGWLLYQTLVCRLWARTAFYQSGGAYGFRDQLQDSLAMLYQLPELTRNQIIYHSMHQYFEGDVQHWWHPEADKGIRTRFSDDLLWLPYVLAEYINVTEDWSILEERTNYLEDACLLDNEDEKYNCPAISDIKGSIYEHSIKAIEHALKFGQHGIPLMGSGDWNDGMNTVGNKGKGESVWLGWFLYSILISFAPLCHYKNDRNRADRYLNIAGEIARALEENAWDGKWYRRAYFDNGVPLGSAENTECKIDSLAQSWAVISEAGKPERILEAMDSLEHYLIKKDDGLILLLTPPFDEGDLEPGYIKGYIPGVRENGGQYTHAATWVVLAYTKMGNGDKAWELYNLLNPINHTSTLMEAARYKVEPYVMAADIYGIQPHVGRGGWTWYTGAAGWMYKVGLQNILGLYKKGDTLNLEPCIPKNWPEYSIEYKYKNTKYSITVKNPNKVNKGIKSIAVDDKTIENNIITLVDDGKDHIVEAVMG